VERLRKENSNPWLAICNQAKLLSNEDLRIVIADLEFEMEKRKLNCQFCGKGSAELILGLHGARICSECLKSQAEEEEKKKAKAARIAEEENIFRAIRMRTERD
jgi:hypothetical protein